MVDPHPVPVHRAEASDLAASLADRFGQDAVLAAQLMVEHLQQVGMQDRARDYLEAATILQDARG